MQWVYWGRTLWNQEKKKTWQLYLGSVWHQEFVWLQSASVSVHCWRIECKQQKNKKAHTLNMSPNTIVLEDRFCFVHYREFSVLPSGETLQGGCLVKISGVGHVAKEISVFYSNGCLWFIACDELLEFGLYGPSCLDLLWGLFCSAQWAFVS